MTLLLKLMNYNKDIPLISAGALPRISDGTGVKSMGRGWIEQVVEARSCLSNLSQFSFDADKREKSEQQRDKRSSSWSDPMGLFFHMLDRRHK